MINNTIICRNLQTNVPEKGGDNKRYAAIAFA